MNLPDRLGMPTREAIIAQLVEGDNYLSKSAKHSLKIAQVELDKALKTHKLSGDQNQ